MQMNKTAFLWLSFAILMSPIASCGNGSPAGPHWWGPTFQITNRALVIPGRVINGTCTSNCTVRPTRYIQVAANPGGPAGNSLGGADYGHTICSGVDTAWLHSTQSVFALAESDGLLYYARDTTLVVYNGGNLPPPIAVDFNTAPGWRWIIDDSLLPDSTILHRGTFGPAPACRVGS